MRVSLSLAALAGVLITAVPASAQVLSDGHVDYAARIVDGQFRSVIKDGTRGTVAWREVPAVTFAVAEGARATVPASAPFLGAAGDSVWMLPQTQRAGLLWLGWNTEEVSSATVDGPVTWRLDAVDGPGAVTVFQTGVFGEPQFVFRSADGLPDSYPIPLGTHAHGNWAFSRTGTYRLTFTMSARLRGGQAVQDTQTLAVTVAHASPATPTPTPAPAGGGPGAPTPTPSPGGPAPEPEAPATAPSLRTLSARVAGRTLRLRLRLDRRSRVAVTVRRGKKTAATVKPRSVSSGTRTLELPLDRRLAAGRHTVRVTATADGRSRTRTITLRVPAR